MVEVGQPNPLVVVIASSFFHISRWGPISRIPILSM